MLLSVIVIATASPAPSTTAMFVVCVPSTIAVTAFDGVARGPIVAASSSAYAVDISRATGMSVTNAGSPSSSLRAANARRHTSTTRCTCSALCQPSAPRSVPRSMFAVSASTMPPDDGGGIVTNV